MQGNQPPTRQGREKTASTIQHLIAVLPNLLHIIPEGEDGAPLVCQVLETAVASLGCGSRGSEAGRPYKRNRSSGSSIAEDNHLDDDLSAPPRPAAAGLRLDATVLGGLGAAPSGNVPPSGDGAGAAALADDVSMSAARSVHAGASQAGASRAGARLAGTPPGPPGAIAAPAECEAAGVADGEGPGGEAPAPAPAPDAAGPVREAGAPLDTADLPLTEEVASARLMHRLAEATEVTTWPRQVTYLTCRGAEERQPLDPASVVLPGFHGTTLCPPGITGMLRRLATPVMGRLPTVGPIQSDNCRIQMDGGRVCPEAEDFLRRALVLTGVELAKGTPLVILGPEVLFARAGGAVQLDHTDLGAAQRHADVIACYSMLVPLGDGPRDVMVNRGGSSTTRRPYIDLVRIEAGHVAVWDAHVFSHGGTCPPPEWRQDLPVELGFAAP